MDNRTINQIRNNETKLINEIKKLEQQNKKYKEVIDKAINNIDIFIEIIKQQPTNNALDDLWILDKLNRIKNILKGDSNE